jgi:DNA primase
MAFSPQFLDELRLRAGLAETVARRMRLVKKGREHIGLCPFHKEKTPSFTLNEDKGFYHCFGCGAHGSVIDFVMQTEGLSFPEAVERLAADAGMEIPAETAEEKEHTRRRQTLLEVTEKAAAFFEKSLRMPEGRTAVSYLREREISDEAISGFRLGYAPSSRSALKAALSRDGIDEDLLVAAGLVIRPDDTSRKAYDRFRGRIIFPITDRRSRVIAFGGRIMGDGEPKYLNSPETALFHKGRVLYGLAQAIDAARKAGSLIVTEGYMDVIALSKAGFGHTVAPLGTALTEDHIREMWRLVPEPVLCFDGDKAGQRAASRALERALPLLKPGYAIRFAVLPPDEDPDSLVRKEGSDAMNRVISQALPLSEMLWRMETDGHGIKTPEERAALEKRLRDHTVRIEDPTVRHHFLDDFKNRLWKRLRGATSATKKPSGSWQKKAYSDVSTHSPAPADLVRLDTLRLQEQILLTVLINHPELADDFAERLGFMSFSSPDLDKLRQEVLKTLAGETGLDSEGLERQLKQDGFSEVLDSLLSPQILGHAFFARPDAPADAAKAGWEETLKLYTRNDLKAELLEAQRVLAENPSPEAFERLRALKDQERQSVDTEFSEQPSDR